MYQPSLYNLVYLFVDHKNSSFTMLLSQKRYSGKDLIWLCGGNEMCNNAPWALHTGTETGFTGSGSFPIRIQCLHTARRVRALHYLTGSHALSRKIVPRYSTAWAALIRIEAVWRQGGLWIQGSVWRAIWGISKKFVRGVTWISSAWCCQCAVLFCCSEYCKNWDQKDTKSNTAKYIHKK